MRRHFTPWLRLAACLLCLLALVHPFASADLNRVLDPAQTASLTIQYADNGAIPDAVTFRLYYIATVDASAAFTPAAPFDGYSIDLRNDLSSSEWQTLANTLTSYAEADQLTPTATKETHLRTVTFTDLRAGLYLVVGQSVSTDTESYTPKPTLIVLPNRTDAGWWEYSVTMTPKWEIRPVEYRDLTVLKVWDDNEAYDRPASVEVELYCNGVLHEAITLSKANNWRYTWTALDTRYTWTAVERQVPDGYTVTITAEEQLLVITNLRTIPPATPEEPDLPKTGSDWTPVTTLAGIGIVLFCWGWLLQRTSDRRGMP